MNIFSTDVNTCSTDKKLKNESKDLNKIKVTEKTFVNSPSKSKFLLLEQKFYSFSIKMFFRMCKIRKQSWKNAET